MDMPQLFSMQVSSVYIALCGLLLIVLTINVARGRIKHQVGIGDGGISALNQAIRVHGNAIEYMPMALLLLVAVENSGVSDGFVHILGSALVICRCLHAAGLYKSAGRTVPRFLGAIGTWLMILVSSVTVLVKVL